MQTNLDQYQFKKIAHALGVPAYDIIFDNRKVMRVLPDKFSRNFYSFEGNKYFDEMVDLGLMTKRDVFGASCYHVTELGIQQFREDFAKLLPYHQKKNRGLEYLKCNINAYCWINQYLFGDDNATEIIQMYKDYYLANFHVSHTTGDVINRFESQLKKFIEL